MDSTNSMDSVEFPALNFDSELESILGFPSTSGSSGINNGSGQASLSSSVFTQGSQCSGCSKYRKDLERMDEEHRTNFKFLKKKIISTDMVIRRFKAKQDECEAQAKKITSLKTNLEKAETDSSLLSEQLKSAMEALNPLQEEKERLEKELRMKDRTVEDLKAQMEERFAYMTQQTALNEYNSNLSHQVTCLEKKNETLKTKCRILESKATDLERDKKQAESQYKFNLMRFEKIALALKKAEGYCLKYWKLCKENGLLSTHKKPDLIPAQYKSAISKLTKGESTENHLSENGDNAAKSTDDFNDDTIENMASDQESDASDHFSDVDSLSPPTSSDSEEEGMDREKEEEGDMEKNIVEEKKKKKEEEKQKRLEEARKKNEEKKRARMEAERKRKEAEKKKIQEERMRKEAEKKKKEEEFKKSVDSTLNHSITKSSKDVEEGKGTLEADIGTISSSNDEDNESSEDENDRLTASNIFSNVQDDNVDTSAAKSGEKKASSMKAKPCEISSAVQTTEKAGKAVETESKKNVRNKTLPVPHGDAGDALEKPKSKGKAEIKSRSSEKKRTEENKNTNDGDVSLSDLSSLSSLTSSSDDDDDNNDNDGDKEPVDRNAEGKSQQNTSEDGIDFETMFSFAMIETALSPLGPLSSSETDSDEDKGYPKSISDRQLSPCFRQDVNEDSLDSSKSLNEPTSSDRPAKTKAGRIRLRSQRLNVDVDPESRRGSLGFYTVPRDVETSLPFPSVAEEEANVDVSAVADGGDIGDGEMQVAKESSKANSDMHTNLKASNAAENGSEASVKTVEAIGSMEKDSGKSRGGGDFCDKIGETEAENIISLNKLAEVLDDRKENAKEMEGKRDGKNKDKKEDEKMEEDTEDGKMEEKEDDGEEEEEKREEERGKSNVSFSLESGDEENTMDDSDFVPETAETMEGGNDMMSDFLYGGGSPEKEKEKLENEIEKEKIGEENGKREKEEKIVEGTDEKEKKEKNQEKIVEGTDEKEKKEKNQEKIVEGTDEKEKKEKNQEKIVEGTDEKEKKEKNQEKIVEGTDEKEKKEKNQEKIVEGTDEKEKKEKNQEKIVEGTDEKEKKEKNQEIEKDNVSKEFDSIVSGDGAKQSEITGRQGKEKLQESGKESTFGSTSLHADQDSENKTTAVLMDTNRCEFDVDENSRDDEEMTSPFKKGRVRRRSLRLNSPALEDTEASNVGADSLPVQHLTDLADGFKVDPHSLPFKDKQVKSVLVMDLIANISDVSDSDSDEEEFNEADKERDSKTKSLDKSSKQKNTIKDDTTKTGAVKTRRSSTRVNRKKIVEKQDVTTLSSLSSESESDASPQKQLPENENSDQTNRVQGDETKTPAVKTRESSMRVNQMKIAEKQCDRDVTTLSSLSSASESTPVKNSPSTEISRPQLSTRKVPDIPVRPRTRRSSRLSESSVSSLPEMESEIKNKSTENLALSEKATRKMPDLPVRPTTRRSSRLSESSVSSLPEVESETKNTSTENLALSEEASANSTKQDDSVEKDLETLNTHSVDLVEGELKAESFTEPSFPVRVTRAKRESFSESPREDVSTRIKSKSPSDGITVTRKNSTSPVVNMQNNLESLNKGVSSQKTLSSHILPVQNLPENPKKGVHTRSTSDSPTDHSQNNLESVSKGHVATRRISKLPFVQTPSDKPEKSSPKSPAKEQTKSTVSNDNEITENTVLQSTEKDMPAVRTRRSSQVNDVRNTETAANTASENISATESTVTDVTPKRITGSNISATESTVTDVTPKRITGSNISATESTVTDVTPKRITGSNISATESTVTDVAPKRITGSNISATESTVTDVAPKRITGSNISATESTVTDVTPKRITGSNISATESTVTDVAPKRITGSTNSESKNEKDSAPIRVTRSSKSETNTTETDSTKEKVTKRSGRREVENKKDSETSFGKASQKKRQCEIASQMLSQMIAKAKTTRESRNAQRMKSAQETEGKSWSKRIREKRENAGKATNVGDKQNTDSEKLGKSANSVSKKDVSSHIEKRKLVRAENTSTDGNIESLESCDKEKEGSQDSVSNQAKPDNPLIKEINKVKDPGEMMDTVGNERVSRTSPSSTQHGEREVLPTQPVKRRRGRPPKKKPNEDSTSSVDANEGSNNLSVSQTDLAIANSATTVKASKDKTMPSVPTAATEEVSTVESSESQSSVVESEYQNDKNGSTTVSTSSSCVDTDAQSLDKNKEAVEDGSRSVEQTQQSQSKDNQEKVDIAHTQTDTLKSNSLQSSSSAFHSVQHLTKSTPPASPEKAVERHARVFSPKIVEQEKKDHVTKKYEENSEKLPESTEKSAKSEQGYKERTPAFNVKETTNETTHFSQSKDGVGSNGDFMAPKSSVEKATKALFQKSGKKKGKPLNFISFVKAAHSEGEPSPASTEEVSDKSCVIQASDENDKKSLQQSSESNLEEENLSETQESGQDDKHAEIESSETGVCPQVVSEQENKSANSRGSHDDLVVSQSEDRLSQDVNKETEKHCSDVAHERKTDNHQPQSEKSVPDRKSESRKRTLSKTDLNEEVEESRNLLKLPQSCHLLSHVTIRSRECISLLEIFSFFEIPRLISPLPASPVSFNDVDNHKDDGHCDHTQGVGLSSGSASPQSTLSNSEVSFLVPRARSSKPASSLSQQMLEARKVMAMKRKVTTTSAIKPPVRSRSAKVQEEVKVTDEEQVPKKVLKTAFNFPSVAVALKYYINQYWGSEVKFKDPDAFVNEVLVQGGGTVHDIWQALAEPVVKVLKTSKENDEILAQLQDSYAQEKEPSDTPEFTTPLEDKILALVSVLFHRDPQLETSSLNGVLWAEIFSQSCKSQALRLVMCRLFASVCKQQGDLEQLRVLAYGIAWCGYLNLAAPYMVIAKVWPAVFSSDPTLWPVSSVLALILRQQMEEKDQQLFENLCNAMKYLTGWDIQESEKCPITLLKALNEEIKTRTELTTSKGPVFEVTKAMELLIVHNGAEFLFKHFVNRILVAVAMRWHDKLGQPGAPHPDHVVEILNVFRAVLAIHPLPHKEVMFVIKQVFQRFVKAKSDILSVEVSFMEALLELSPFCLQASIELVNQWLANNKGKVPPQTFSKILQAKNILIQKSEAQQAEKVKKKGSGPSKAKKRKT